ncbi:lumazine-binding domain protein [Nocardiopsis sp. B62]|uniref:lumazine-binding domain protein n=1 Tax=Nocardiopsis sp. B62 TaxID=2824874 RepID=UPI001B392668|nr:lumazine-binding domain protein [Nocardiopsis sp. B62]MBQ1080518.1 lumazine-binding domain protein [Nocardiopsis sp. B62]
MRRILLCAALPLFIVLTACSGGDEAPAEETAEEAAGAQGGSEPSEEDAAEATEAARTVAEGFVAALAVDDGELACTFADESAQAAIIGQGEDGQDCVEAFPAYAAGLPDADGIEVGEVTVSTDLNGDTLVASVEMVHAEETLGSLEVREVSPDEWRATRLPGTTLGGA